jgi:hypothetical protein
MADYSWSEERGALGGGSGQDPIGSGQLLDQVGIAYAVLQGQKVGVHGTKRQHSADSSFGVPGFDQGYNQFRSPGNIRFILACRKLQYLFPAVQLSHEEPVLPHCPNVVYIAAEKNYWSPSAVQSGPHEAAQGSCSEDENTHRASLYGLWEICVPKA